jgi:replicative DNA helicase
VEQYLRRKSVVQLTDLIQQILNDRIAVEDTITEGGASLQKLVQTQEDEHLYSIEQLALSQFQRIQESCLQPESNAGISTGFPNLDAVITGFLPGQLYVIGARPSVGKTTLMVNLLLHALLHPKQKNRALYYSLKESAELLSQRLLSCVSGIMYEKIARGKLDEQELNQLYKSGVEPLANSDLAINDRPLLRVSDIRKLLLNSKDRSYNIVFIDQLQHILASKGRYRDEEVSVIMKELKLLAREFNIPIVVSSQLNRTVDLRRDGNRMPQLSDLRDSGGIEQEADVVLFLYRPEYYDIVLDELGQSNKGETHIRVAKNRTGPLDTIRLKALLHIQKFVDFDMDNEGLFVEFVPKDKNLSEDQWTRRFEDERMKNSDNKLQDDEAPF